MEKNADGMANSVDPDQIALVWVITVCPGLSVQLELVFIKHYDAPNKANIYAISHLLFSILLAPNNSKEMIPNNLQRAITPEKK